MSRIMKIFFGVMIISWLCDAFGVQPTYGVAAIIFLALTASKKKEED